MSVYSAMIYNPDDLADRHEFKVIDRRDRTPRQIWDDTEAAMVLMGWEVAAMRAVEPLPTAWYPEHLFVEIDVHART